MEEHLISVVLPTYNGEKYICESVDSILSQTYENWELIIVDDCSTDETLQIAASYAKDDKRIKVLHNDVNCKLPQALNVGFSETKGGLLTWTSDDNRFLPNAFEIMSHFFIEHNDVHMLCANMYEIDADGTRRREIIYPDEGKLCIENSIGACFMYTRDVYEKIGNYDINLFCVEDYDYWIRIKKNYGEITRIPDILYEYRIHGESLSGIKRQFINRQLLRLRKKHLEYLLQSFAHDKTLLFHMYMELLSMGCDDAFFTSIAQYIPELKYETGVDSNRKKFIIFGAGDYGERAWAVLQDKVFCFVDNDRNKVGSIRKGLQVKSFEELLYLANEYYIMVAVSSSYGYEILKQLSENGITNYCTYQYYMWRNVYGICEERAVDNFRNR